MPVTSVSYFTAAGQPAFTDVATVGPIVWIDPFEDVTARVLFRQAYQTAITAFSPTSLDSTYPAGTVAGTTYLLVREGDFQEIGGGQMRWNRYYACTPPTRTEYTSRNEVFPGIASTTFRRAPMAFPTPAKITRAYYLVGTVPTLTAEDRVTITGTLDAPLLSENYLNAITNPTMTDYISDKTTDASTPGSFSIRAEGEFIERWIGNFYARVTTEVKAK